MSRAIALFLAIGLWCSPLLAFEIPLAELLYGPSNPSLIEDLEIYPASHLSLEFGYWDIYHERDGDKLHDYNQASVSLRGLRQNERMFVGVRVERAEFSAEQQNVYTDADRMSGRVAIGEGAILLGTARRNGEFAAGVREFQATASVGYRDGFAGDIETLVGWGRAATIHLRAETFETNLDVEEEIVGFDFPFHFPYRTYRAYGRVESVPKDPYRLRVWGTLGKSSGEGEPESDFENRPAVDEYSFGGRLDYGLEVHDRFQNTPRKLPSDSGFPGVRLTALQDHAAVNLDMYFDGTRYLRLDDLQLAETNVRLDVVPFRWGALFGGWQRFRVEHDGDSFVDVWPFTIWDVFAAKRYRLGPSDVELQAWYAGAGVLVERRRYEIDITGRFEWWEDTGVLNLLERVDDLFPFFFHYERTQNDVDLSARYAVQVDPTFVFRAATSIDLRLSGRIAFPFGPGGDEGEGDGGGGGGPPQPAPPSQRSVHGGVWGRLELVIAL